MERKAHMRSRTRRRDRSSFARFAVPTGGPPFATSATGASKASVQVENVCYDYYEGDFQTMPTLDTLAAKRDRLAGPLSRTVAERPAGFGLRFDGQTLTT